MGPELKMLRLYTVQNYWKYARGNHDEIIHTDENPGTNPATFFRACPFLLSAIVSNDWQSFRPLHICYSSGKIYRSETRVKSYRAVGGVKYG
jgi:hypothetical protein